MNKRRRRIHAEPTAFKDIYIAKKPLTFFPEKYFYHVRPK